MVIFGIFDAGIGAWQVVFDIMGYLAIITNSALIGLFAYKANLLPDTSNFDLLLIVIGLEVGKLMYTASYDLLLFNWYGPAIGTEYTTWADNLNFFQLQQSVKHLLIFMVEKLLIDLL